MQFFKWSVSCCEIILVSSAVNIGLYFCFYHEMTQKFFTDAGSAMLEENSLFGKLLGS
jgi:hypothetical protein